jgi:hypothetical protein
MGPTAILPVSSWGDARPGWRPSRPRSTGAAHPTTHEASLLRAPHGVDRRLNRAYGRCEW